MNKVWIRKDQNGVSPVIATILMVAITVVLAAVLYLMVAGIDPQNNTTPTGTITLGLEGGSTMEARFGAFTSTVTALEAGLQIVNGTETSSYDYDETAKAWVINGDDNANTGTSIAFHDLGDDGEVNNGDYLLVPVQRDSDYTVRIVINGDESAVEELST